MATVILRHTLADGTWHYDWMVERPDAPETGDSDNATRTLATWRMTRSAADWRAGDRITLERIGDHRRAYLTYQGPVSGGRGRVDRVDEGQATAIEWSAQSAVLEVRLGGFTGRVELRCIEGGAERQRGIERWVAIVLERTGGDDMMR